MTKTTRWPPRRILMWLPHLSEHGGIGRHNRTLCKVLAGYAREHETIIDIVSLRDPRAFYDPEFLTRPVVGCEGSSHRFGLAALASLRHTFDLMVVGVVDFGPLVPLARLRCPSAPIVTIVHGIEVWEPLPPQTRVALTQATAIMSVSGYTANRVAEQQGVPRTRVEVIPPPLDPEFLLNATSEPATFTPVRSRLLSISRLNRVDAPKGVDRVIEALPMVRLRVPEIDYLIVGTGDDRTRLEELARRTGVDDLIQFCGTVSDAELHGYLHGTDLFVLPSYKEGFGIVFLEAAIHRRAVIGTHEGGIPEVVIDGETGVLVNGTSTQELADAISDLLLDDERRMMLGSTALERVQRVYSYEAFRDRVLVMVDRLTGQRN